MTAISPRSNEACVLAAGDHSRVSTDLVACHQGDSVRDEELMTETTATGVTATETTPSREIVTAATDMESHLPFSDPTDLEDAKRGFLGSQRPGQVRAADGRVVWDADAWSSVLERSRPDTVNPSLWRQAKLVALHGLYEVTEGIYQGRSMDLSNMTVVEAATGSSSSTPDLHRDRGGGARPLPRPPRRPAGHRDDLHAQPCRPLRRRPRRDLGRRRRRRPYPRPGSRGLAQPKRPDRSWNAVVVGEGTRCWFGNQFSLIAPRFAAHEVDLWVPELGGKFDRRNPSHKMLMSVLGGMSESERQHVQARVRAAMDAQVVNEGRHQGGRAPYGYVVADTGPHPNPRKAAEGYRLRVLAIDDASAEVVRRIFAQYLDGRGDRAIAGGLNRDGIPCPSARRPDQNRHRLADGWQASTVRAILDNPRYTGYAFFGRWTKHETLLDLDDVAAGHVVRFRRAGADRVVRSREPAHPSIVSVETFTEAQLRRRSRAAGGNRQRAKLERTRTTGTRPYLLRGMVRCALCSRRMQGAVIRKHAAYYRCLARTLAPGTAAHADHPRTVNLREYDVEEPLNAGIGHVFDRRNVDRTVAALVASQDGGGKSSERETAKRPCPTSNVTAWGWIHAASRWSAYRTSAALRRASHPEQTSTNSFGGARSKSSNSALTPGRPAGASSVTAATLPPVPGVARRPPRVHRVVKRESAPCST
jgi:hypothetical protein